MFKSVLRKMGGVLTYKDLVQRSEHYIESAMNAEEDRDVALLQLDENLSWLEAWREEHQEILRRIADCSSKQDQIIALRRETLILIESSTAAQPFLLDELTEEDKGVLSKELHPDMAFEDVMSLEFQLCVFSEASSRCLRLISFELGDARKNDWFVMYCDVYGQVVEHTFREMIAQAKDEIYPLGTLAVVAKQMADEAKEKVLQGYNWDYDKEAMERERLEEEERSKEEEPPKQRTVSRHQIEELTSFLVERVERAQNGELYNVQGYKPTSPLNVITVDTGLMLIALSECVEGREAAISAARDVMWSAVQEIAPGSTQEQSKDDVSLDAQMELLSMWEENRDEGPLAGVCLVAFHLLYDIEPKDGDKEHSRAIGAMGAELIDDAWEVIATTKNVFGWKLGAKGLFAGDET